MSRIIITVVICFLFQIARSQNVGGGLSLAGVASQIDGDQWGGYNKLGWHFGGFAYYDFTDRLSLMAEILYCNKGSREVKNAYGQIAIHTIDVPFSLRYKFELAGEQAIYPEAGTSANILLRSVYGINSKIDRTDWYNRYFMEAHAGLTMMFNRYIGIFGRWSVSYTNLLNLNVLQTRAWYSLRYISAGIKIGLK